MRRSSEFRPIRSTRFLNCGIRRWSDLRSLKNRRQLGDHFEMSGSFEYRVFGGWPSQVVEKPAARTSDRCQLTRHGSIDECVRDLARSAQIVPNNGVWTPLRRTN